LKISRIKFLSLLKVNICYPDAKEIPCKYILWEDYSLQHLASDVEIANSRTDFRLDRVFRFPKVEIQAGRIPNPESLSLGQQIWITDQILSRICSWLNGSLLMYCFYDFSYFHDNHLWSSNPFLTSLIESTHFTMEKIYALLIHCRKVLDLKSDDLMFGFYSFLRIDKSDKSILKSLDELMKPLSKNLNKIKSKFVD
jgi:hypothetical protein